MKLYALLKTGMSSQKAGKVIEKLIAMDYGQSSLTGKVFLIGSNLYCVEHSAELGDMLWQFLGDTPGQIVIDEVVSPTDLKAELRKSAIQYDVTDYEIRIMGTVLE